MSEAQNWKTTSFNHAVKLRSSDPRLSAEGGAILLREVDHRLGFLETLAAKIADPRRPDRIRYRILELLRECVYGQALGYGTDDELDRLAHDPALRLATWDRPGERVLHERLASQPTHSRLLGILSGTKQNLEAVRGAMAASIEKHLRAGGQDHGVHWGTLDVDSFPQQIYGNQAGGAYHGYYQKKIYHPLVAGFAPEGNYDAKRAGEGFVHAILRGGKKDSATGAVRFIRSAVDKCRGLARRLDVRFDAAFTEGPIMDALTDDGIRFLGRLANNPALDRLARPYLFRPIGRPPKEGYEFTVELGPYRASSEKHAWKHTQRLILVVSDLPDARTGQLNLLPHYFFLVTNWAEHEMSADDLLVHYRDRGTFEDRIGEFQGHVQPLLSSPDFETNEAAFLLALLSFNLVSILRGELECATSSGWSLERVQRSVLKAGVLIQNAGHRILVNVAAAVTTLWNAVFRRLDKWCVPQKWPAPTIPRPRPWTPPPAHAHLELVLRA